MPSPRRFVVQGREELSTFRPGAMPDESPSSIPLFIGVAVILFLVFKR